MKSIFLIRKAAQQTTLDTRNIKVTQGSASDFLSPLRNVYAVL